MKLEMKAYSDWFTYIYKYEEDTVFTIKNITTISITCRKDELYTYYIKTLYRIRNSFYNLLMSLATSDLSNINIRGEITEYLSFQLHKNKVNWETRMHYCSPVEISEAIADLSQAFINSLVLFHTYCLKNNIPIGVNNDR